MTDALGFAAYTVTNVLPYLVKEMVAIAFEYPAMVALFLFVLWEVYIIVSIALHYGRILLLIGAGYVAVVFLQRYLATR